MPIKKKTRISRSNSTPLHHRFNVHDYKNTNKIPKHTKKTKKDNKIYKKETIQTQYQHIPTNTTNNVTLDFGANLAPFYLFKTTKIPKKSIPRGIQI